MKTFVTDKQTLEDLNIFGKKAGYSVYELFNKTHTRGGAELLEQLFRLPLADKEAINRRSSAFKYFGESRAPFPFRGEWLDTAEKYLADTDERSKLTTQDNTLGRKMNQLLGADNPMQAVTSGINAITSMLHALQGFISATDISVLEAAIGPVQPVLDKITRAVAPASAGKRNFEQTAILDQLFRFTWNRELQQFLHFIYQLDVYLSVAAAGRQHHFVFPFALDTPTGETKIEGVYHPFVENARTNTVLFSTDRNVFFLTGANMAGKSTLMKSLAIAVYLAHLGFPVPAARMEFTVMDGMFTTINLADNLDLGYSHFYAEVNRVKKVSQLLEQRKKLFVVFDELFRGTNVKDAYEATVAVIGRFTGRPSSRFLVSSHILEAGELLQQSSHIQFAFLPTLLKDGKPVYTYTLEPGLSADRHGMLIVQEAGIPDILQRQEKKPAGQGFQTDKQTLDDLNMLGKFRNSSIFSLFNQTFTGAGEKLLEQMFRVPLNDPGAIRERTDMLSFFGRLDLRFPVTAHHLETATDFIHTAGGSQAKALLQHTRHLALKYIGLPNELEQVKTGLISLTIVVREMQAFIAQLKTASPNHPFLHVFAAGVRFLEDPRLQALDAGSVASSPGRIIHHDLLFRQTLLNGITDLLRMIAHLDVLLAVSRVGKEKHWCYAQALPMHADEIYLQDFHHPAISNSIDNTLHISRGQPLVFLTGANMAGKSTLMKAVGIAVYLAHMGFPVAAAEMQFSVREGIFTSINVPDNLKAGYSHFYAEVLRVKMIVEKVSHCGHLLVIFDELFKGTNVKDAYDATLAVTAGMTLHPESAFIVSTHITEVGEALQASHPQQVQFLHLPTIMNGPEPTYPRKLASGISADRHGMMIIRNEKILDILQPETAVSFP